MIYLSKPYFDDAEVNAVKETLASGWVAGQGPRGSELSELVKFETGLKYAMPVSSCTAGLHLSLLAIGIKTGDEVIVSDFTFPATGHSVMYCGAIPRFVDVKLSSYNIDPSLIEEKISDKTKAIIVVHALGQIAEMDEIKRIAHKYNLKLVEDAACAMGALYRGKQAGTFSDIACFSFHARKNTTSGEGGIVVTDNENYADIVSSLSCFGIESAYHRQKIFSIPTFTALGYNYKLSDINAAIAIEQIKKYPLFLSKKRKLVDTYNRLLSKNELLTLPVEGTDNLHIYQTYAVLLNKRINRDHLLISLQMDGIQTQIGTYASHIQPIYNSKDVCPNSMFLFQQTLALPLYYQLTENEIEFVVQRLDSHMKTQLVNG